MASSQVEIASSSPLGCVLRDSSNNSHRREQWRRESKERAAARAAFQKNLLKDLFVKDHFHSNENSHNPQIQNSNFLVPQQQQQTNNNNNNKIDRWARAREMVSSDDFSSVGGGGGGGGVGGVSSLVQRWRDLAAEESSTSTKLNQPNSARSNPPAAGSSSMIIINENACESVDETPSSIMSTEDSSSSFSSSSFPDWESDRTSPPTQPSSARESEERIRVADIIKKLKLSVVNDSARDQIFDNLPTLSDQTDQNNRGFSPRIRGRQAFTDLLMHMERDRHRELEGLLDRRAVSRFQQRGRIQSLLRLKFLRREATVGGNEHSTSAASGSNRLAQGSTITLLRERFNTGVENDATNLKSPPRGEVVNVEISSTSNQLLRGSIQHQEATNTTDRQSSSSPVQSSVNLHEEPSSTSSGSVWQRQRTSHKVEKNLEETSPINENLNNLELQQPEHKVTSLSARDDNVNSEEQEGNNMQLVRSDCEWESEISGGRGGRWGEQEADHDWLSVLSQPQSDWEQQLVENNIDWISDISRPRSDWEGLRQARYQEMLDPYSENEDVRKLLERRSVSTFLSSNLRETMDQLMISRAQNSIQRPPHQIDSQQEEEEEGLHERMIQFMMSSGTERQTESMDSQQEETQQAVEKQEEEPEDDYEEDDEEEENEAEEESLIGNEYNENGDYFDQSTPSRQQPLPSLTRPWKRNRDQEISDDSDPTLSPSLRQPSSSHSSFHPSIEMELIYDLRGHMEQLHHEMSELRRTINSCMSMQVKLQHSIKQEVAAAVSHSAGGESKKSVNRRRGAPSKGGCCVCYEKQVDSLLYRCGHMCTCFKCAHDLQWSSGKCPICRAPIVDIVRAYTDSEYRFQSNF